MRNLTIYNQDVQKHSNIDQWSELDSKSNYFCCVDPDNDDFYFLTKYGIHLLPSNKKNPENILNIDRYSTYSPVGMTFIEDRVFFAFEDGEVISADIYDDTGENDVLEILNTNLQCMQISPDQEIVALISTEEIVMTVAYSNFQIVSKVK